MSDFAQSACEALAPLGRVASRRMFGGHGLYLDGQVFALIVRDTLYLKTDAQSAPQFDALALPPFAFERAGKTVATSYRQAPEDIFEDRDAARHWGTLAMDAALRASAAKPAKARRTVNATRRA